MLVLGLLASPAAAQYNSVDGTIRGQVVDESSGVPLPGVRVELLDARERIRRTTETDAEGQFVLTRLNPGEFWLRATRFGYVRTKTPGWRIESGEILTVAIRMDADFMLLAPLEITARVRTASPVLSAFQTRLERRMGGTLFSREDIERRNAMSVTDLLREVPGLDLLNSREGNNRMVRMTRALPGRGGETGCPVQLYLDGVLATRGGQEVSPDELVVPGSLEGIEVYRGLATLPAEFLTPEARCGVIALWTKRRGSGGT